MYVSLTSKLWSKHATNVIALQGAYGVHTKVEGREYISRVESKVQIFKIHFMRIQM